MKALKILNIALFALIIALLLQLIFPKPAENTTADGIFLKIESKSVVIPNLPKITVLNNTSETVNILPCENISLYRNSQKITKLSEEYPDFCKEIVVPAKSSEPLKFDALYKFFASTVSEGDYNLDLITENSENKIAFTVEKPGFFRSFLSTLVYQPIYNLFVGILIVLPGHELGWAIVLVTIIIRLILLVPQHRMLESSRKMGLIGPKIKALQQEYKDDRATLGMKMMELYKKEGINPMSSCLPLLIQFPILTGLYCVISSISDVSNFYHLYSFFGNFNPADIETMFFWYDLVKTWGTITVVVAIVLMVTQWLQAWLSFKNQPTLPKKDNKKSTNPDEIPALDPQVMQKMMLYVFPVMIGAMALFFPLGLGLYWWIGLLFMIVQQLYVNTKGNREKKMGEIIKKS